MTYQTNQWYLSLKQTYFANKRYIGIRGAYYNTTDKIIQIRHFCLFYDLIFIRVYYEHSFCLSKHRRYNNIFSRKNQSVSFSITIFSNSSWSSALVSAKVMVSYLVLAVSSILRFIRSITNSSVMAVLVSDSATVLEVLCFHIPIPHLSTTKVAEALV